MPVFIAKRERVVYPKISGSNSVRIIESLVGPTLRRLNAVDVNILTHIPNWRFSPSTTIKSDLLDREGYNLSQFCRANNLGKMLRTSTNSLGYLKTMLLGIND